jgi:hypothetical protein
VRCTCGGHGGLKNNIAIQGGQRKICPRVRNKQPNLAICHYTKKGEVPRSKEENMCLHRFYVAPHEAAQSSHLPSYQQVISPTIKGAKDYKVESHKMHVRDFKMRGLDDGIKSVSDNPTVKFKH